MPSLERIHERYKGRDFALIAINIEENKETVLNHVRKNGLSFTNLLDTDGQVSVEYGVRSTPMKYLIDKEGNMVGVALGYRNWDQDEINILIEALLNK